MNTLQGRSLVLRRLLPSDAEQLHIKYYLNPHFIRLYRPNDYSTHLASTRHILTTIHYQLSLSQSPTFEYAFFRGPHLIGLLSLADINTSSQHAQILFGIFPYHAIGMSRVVAEAILLALSLAFNHMGLRRLYAYILDYNSHAATSITKCGFQLEGRMRKHFVSDNSIHDLLVFGCLKEDLCSQPSVQRLQSYLLNQKVF